MAFLVPIGLLAQTNTVPVVTNTVSVATNQLPADTGTPTALLPSMPGDYWVLGIGIVTPFIVSGVRKLVPSIPTVLLPAMTPLIGIFLGFALNWASHANLSWFDAAKAGALAVFFREVVD